MYLSLSFFHAVSLFFFLSIPDSLSLCFCLSVWLSIFHTLYPLLILSSLLSWIFPLLSNLSLFLYKYSKPDIFGELTKHVFSFNVPLLCFCYSTVRDKKNIKQNQYQNQRLLLMCQVDWAAREISGVELVYTKHWNRWHKIYNNQQFPRIVL